MKLRTWERGNIALRIAVNLALVALAVLIYLKKDVIFNRRQAPPIAAQPSVTPEPTPKRTPRPERPDRPPAVNPEADDQPVEQPRIETPPVAPPAPATTPKPSGLGALVARPEMWPRQVKLREAVSFTLIRNGVAAGKIQVPAGTLVEVRKFNGTALELGYRDALAVAAVGATDFETLTRAKQSAAASAPPASAEVAAPDPAPPTSRTTASTQSADPRRLDVEVIRSRKTRAVGAYYDDKTDQVSLRMKLKNQDLQLPFEGLKGHIFVFAESVTARGTVNLLQKQHFDISLPARESMEFETEEAVTTYDTVYFKSGYKYSGWVFLVRDRSGKIVFEKSSSPSLLHDLDKLSKLSAGSDYDKSTWAPRRTPRRALQ